MKLKTDSFSKLLTPILIVAIVLFAGLVSFASYKAYQRELENVENYTHARMKSLILDLETKLMTVEASMVAQTHRRHLDMQDSLQIYESLTSLISDQPFINYAGFEIWSEDMPDSLSYLFYVSKLPDNQVKREFTLTSSDKWPSIDLQNFQKALESLKPEWSQPYQDTYYSKDNVITCYLRVPERTAMFYSDVELSKLLRTIDSLQFYDNSKMYIVTKDQTTYALDNGKIVNIGDNTIDEKHFTKISAHYRHLDIDIINIVPNDQIFSRIWKNIFIVFIIFLIGLTCLAILVHHSFKKAQEDLAESLRKSNEEQTARKKIENEIAIAGRIQNKMLTAPGRPVHFEPEGGKAIDIMARMIPAREVGGDLYEYKISGDKLVFCIGDVSGKGVPASLVMSMCSTLFHSYVGYFGYPDPAMMLTFLNKQLCRRNEETMFVTMWVGVMDVKTGKVEYASAGHNPPVLVHEGAAKFLEMSQGVPLGLFDDSTYVKLECTLDPDAALLLYTDGITEAENPEHDLFSDGRLLRSCACAPSLCPEALCQNLLKAVYSHASGCDQSDDITLLCVTCGARCAQLHGIDDVQALHVLTENCDAPFEAALVLEEAAVNAFNHGGATFVCAEYDGTQFTMTADGDEFDPTRYVVPEKADGELTIGGRGIPLIRQLCSSTTYRRTSNGLNIQTFKLK